MNKLIALVGSNADQSTNRQLLQFIQSHFASQADIELLEIKGLALFNKPADKQIPENVKAMADKIEAADGVIISTPEYDHAIPAALMNALNWLSFEVFPFVDKPVMITGASYGTLGSSRAQSHLRQMLHSPELKARLMPGSEFLLSHSLQAFDENNNLKDPQIVEQLEGVFADFMTFVEISKQLNQAHSSNKQAAANFSWEEPTEGE